MTKQFTETLEAMRDGNVMVELEKMITEVVASVRATGKKGVLSLTITIDRMKGGEPHMLLITDDITVRLPKPDKAATFMYATNENALSRRDPRQPELGFEPRRLVSMHSDAS